MDFHFIVPELTMAPHTPAMAGLVPLFEAFRERAHQDAAAKAEEVAERLAHDARPARHVWNGAQRPPGP